MALKQSQEQGQKQQYPVVVIPGEWKDKPTVRITTNEKNPNFDAFKGGVNKFKNLLAVDDDGDSVLGTAIKFFVDKGEISPDEVNTFFQNLKVQLFPAQKDESTPF